MVTRDDHRLVRIVEERDALGRRDVLEAKDVADVHGGDVDVDVLGNLHRESLDLELARDERDDAARLGADRFADEVNDDRCLDRLIEPHLAEVDVGDLPAHGILLILGQDRRMHGRLTLEHDVEDRVQPRRPGHRGPQILLRDRDRARMPLPVEHARNRRRRCAGAASGASRARSPRAREPRA